VIFNIFAIRLERITRLLISCQGYCILVFEILDLILVLREVFFVKKKGWELVANPLLASELSTLWKVKIAMGSLAQNLE